MSGIGTTVIITAAENNNLGRLTRFADNIQVGTYPRLDDTARTNGTLPHTELTRDRGGAGRHDIIDCHLPLAYHT